MNDKQKELINQMKENRKKKAAERKEKMMQEQAKANDRKQQKLAEKQKNKEFYKTSKAEIKSLKKEYHEAIKENNHSNLDKEVIKAKRDVIHDEYTEKIITIKNAVLDRKFEYGKKYRTLNWKLLKWVYGIRKEFNRIIWSSPINTFKYLAIIVILVLLLSLIFLAIDAIVNSAIK